MSKTVIFLALIAISVVSALPAKKEALDKATATDVVVNSVNPDSKIQVIPKEEREVSTDKVPEVYVADINFGPPTTNTQQNKPGHAVARIIDDIFQIPIGVLQSVARLLRNPFISNKTPEKTSSY